MSRSGRTARIGEFEIRVIIDEINEQYAENPGICRSPSEPEKCSRREFGNDLFLGVAIHCRGERSVDPIEKIKQSDPEYSEKNVKPPENRVEILNELVHEASLIW